MTMFATYLISPYAISLYPVSPYPISPYPANNLEIYLFIPGSNWIK